ncbi:LysE family translocator [Sediminibacterium goheungense]|uniref:Threonine/homoserine/homoserine lactone efflux protein n=1 Tax=Sediminibacterium goheungense TaxID=1086393 RepID=A0A4R6J207_9BACT|nr:LysE family translocator [Sediminibacterium goheungense]TDO29299.1 threonine/homoserine/homoserine lactone efflux protein [Sediminibacterium goheungense]
MIAPLMKGLILGLILSISVGPVIFAIIKQSINNGHKAGYVFVAGVSASDITLVMVCNFFTGLFNTALSYKNTIAIAGSIFLIAVGVYTLFFKKVQVDEENKLLTKTFRKRDYAGIFLSGYFMNMLNPGVFLFWFAWTTLIMADSQTATHPGEYRFIVFTTCLLFVLLADIAKVVLAGKLRSRLNAKNLRFINKLSGLILIGFGVALCWGVLALFK